MEALVKINSSEASITRCLYCKTELNIIYIVILLYCNVVTDLTVDTLAWFQGRLLLYCTFILRTMQALYKASHSPTHSNIDAGGAAMQGDNLRAHLSSVSTTTCSPELLLCHARQKCDKILACTDLLAHIFSCSMNFLSVE